MSASECYVTMEARLGSNLQYLADNLTLQNPSNDLTINFKTFYPRLFAFSAGEDKIPISMDESR